MYANAWEKFHRKGLLSQERGDSPQHEGEIDNLTVQCLWWHSTIFKQQCFRFSSFAWNEKELQSFPPKVQGRPRKNKKEAAESDLILKRKAKDEEIQKVKQKISGIESCIKSLREEVSKQTLLADKKKDLVCAVKAASLCRTVKEKEETRKELVTALKKLEEEHKKL